MNPLDIVIVVIVAYCLIRGIFRGLIKEVASIVGVFAGFYAAYSHYGLLSQWISRWVTDNAYANILSFLFIFSAVFVLVSILGVVIKYALQVAFLGWVDRICGAGFGLVKGVLICAVITLSLTAFLRSGSPLVRDSVLAPHITVVSETMAKVVSREMRQKFSFKMTELKTVWKTQR